MNRKIAIAGAIAALVAVVAISQTNEGQSTLAWISGEDPQDKVLTNPNNGQPVTLEAVQKEAEWRKDTAEQLRKLD
ncbi:hypothetical protein HBA54_10135 [Pelagibius litoralis]|uniref:Secreted protein n=1 Tax=Pelagibius litoralis TaxID=374515 RepID=A0A967C7C2_9PROT|nr:hypothetical protein [Pelagibius litoralis]NIA68951.1 hypothetical protein [Pelagibius litoralis]